MPGSDDLAARPAVPILLRRIRCALLLDVATGALRAHNIAGPRVRAGDRDGMHSVALRYSRHRSGADRDGVRNQGTLYVRVDDVWHPVLNLASGAVDRGDEHNRSRWPVRWATPNAIPPPVFQVRRSCLTSRSRRQIGVGDLR